MKAPSPGLATSTISGCSRASSGWDQPTKAAQICVEFYPDEPVPERPVTVLRCVQSQFSNVSDAACSFSLAIGPPCSGESSSSQQRVQVGHAPFAAPGSADRVKASLK